jgi:hypothetical protein
MRGRHGSASMSATEQIGSSQLIRSRWGSSRPVVPSSRAGSSIDAAVQAGLRAHGHVDVAVAALHVDDVHAVQARELCDQVVVPAGRRVQLEAERRVDGEQGLQREEARGFPDPDGGHEVDRPGRTSDGLLEREAALAQGEVERSALERPPPVEAGAGADRLDREEVGETEQRRELLERARAP